MNTNNFTPVGIDVSKATLDVFVGDKVCHCENNEKGFQRITSKLPRNSWCVMESTSTYGYRFADYLVEHDFRVSVVNPLSVKRFAQMNLSRTKTDKADAKLITEYAKIAELPEYEPTTDAMNELRQLETVLEQLIKQRTALQNQIEALEQLPRPSKAAIKALKDAIKTLDQQIEAIKQQMHQDALTDCPEAYEKALSVKGIGKRTATLLMAITKGFTLFENARQISAYIGACPKTVSSGTSVKGKSHICKIGLADVRATLYMCAHAAVKYNNACKALYERLIAKGKAKKVALIAVVNKLIHQVFACVSKNEFFNNNYNFSFGF
jgi:transposase